MSKRIFSLPPEEDQTGILLWFQHIYNHFNKMFLMNLITVLCLLPALFCITFLINSRDLVFWVAAAVLAVLAGPCITALNGVAVRIVHRRPVWLKEDLKRSWKKDWLPSMILTAILVALWSALIYAVYLVILSQEWSLGHLLLFLVCAYLLTGLTLFSYQQLSMMELSVGKILKNSFLLIFVGGLRSVFAILPTMLAWIACGLFLEWTMLLLLIGLPMLTVYTANLIYRPVFQRLFLTETTDNDTRDNAEEDPV